MSDLIDREAALNKITAIDTSIIPYVRAREYVDELKNYIIKIIKTLPSAEPERKWIPVTERLPKKENKSYWVCTDTKYQCKCRWTNNIYGIGESSEWGWKIFDIPQYTKVVAWMPLPKPYGGE